MQYKCMKGQKIHQRTGWVMASSTVSLLFLHGGHDYEETGTHFYHHIFADFLLESSGAAPFLTSAIVSYLVVTETLSIVENLSEAGAGGLERLAQLVRKKM